MKRVILLILVGIVLGIPAVYAQVLRPMTVRYNNPSVKGNIVFVSNNIITSVGVATNEAPPAGTAVNNGHLGMQIDIDGNGTNNTTIIAMGDTWKYYATGSAPAGSWKNLGYNDAAWASGPTEMGYGDGDEATCIPSGGGGTLCAPTGNKYIASYFRKTVNIANPSSFGSFILNVERDDGVVVYVNGIEVLRDNMPTGVITYSSLAVANVEDAQISVSLANSLFISGNNDIAVEVHQSSASSSDLSFNLSLEATTKIYKYISMGDTWKYWANTQANAPAATWTTTGFNDAAWPAGATEMGYGDGDEVTCIPSGGSGGTLCLPTGNKYITTYFRKQINITNPNSFGSFQFNVERDDGFVLYVNGVEVARNNMPAGAIAYNTLASADVEDAVIKISVPTSIFVAGVNTIAVEIHQRAASSTDLSFNLSLDAYTDIFIPFGSSWKYLDNNTRPASWETTGFNDAAWAAGNAYLGYGDPHIVTTVNYGPDANNKYITTYFRKTVNIPNASSFPQFLIRLRRDDGAVVYVNGTEVGRSNMPGGGINHSTLASGNVGGAEETADNLLYINPSFFVNGNNTIAVEVHQELPTSSDLGFDLQLEGSYDTTFNSSSADLNLPSCSQVLFAGLYWGASQGTDGTNTSWITNETNVKLKLPGAANYVNLTSTQTDYHNNTLVPGLPHTGYRCFRDITSLINTTNYNGTYTLANVCGPAGIINASGGWTIVLAYSDPASIAKNLTVYDGSVIMNGGDPSLHVPITGFLTPPSGPVSCELGAVVYDGDRVSTDEFSFKQNSNPLVGTYTNLTPNATANLNDMWNSTISYKGSVVTTRMPAHQNTLGYDADIIDVPNALNAVLGNSQTSASIRFSSPSENYMIQVATTAITQYTPVFRVRKSATDLDGGALDPGDSIRYRVDYTNGGNDASTTTTIIDNIPAGTSYAPNSLVIGGVSKTDAVGDDEAEYDFTNNRVIFRLGTGANGTTGGEVNPGASGYVTFKVYTPVSCAALTCNSSISNRARMTYAGKLSLLSMIDSSGVDIAGCIMPDPVVNLITGSCSSLQDTILTNTCPSLQVMLPVARYAGYSFHTGMPFDGGTRYNTATPVTFSRVIYAFYDGPGNCDDTIRINIYISGCPDIDDDNDGLPDYLELNNPLALADADGDGISNWADPTPGGGIIWVDNNIDNSNDWFDAAADVDNDGILNFYDTDFPGFIDSNGDNVNDNMDKDLDGIPNNFDLDSDNDGIPDTAESFGVDANGDGRIDNYSDTDGDGLSQNVDASGPGPNFIYGSGLGLGALDTDGDGFPNYLDLDSDNDGIPDIIEAFGTDENNSAKVNVFVDTDGDGYADALDADVGNDNIAENSGAALLLTGIDANNDGRTDTWPNRNMDSDNKPGPYDLDSDGDGITDVKEAQFTDANWDGRVDGAVNTNGRNTVLAGLPSLSIPNSDGTGRVNPYDIDSDDDGIPDNVEGMSTTSYLLPSTLDSDNDGIVNTYDNFIGFGGDGIHPVDVDGDTMPDYFDSDTDGDGMIDRVEGNDLNLNYLPDDNVTLTGIDTDGDGLDDRFDNNNFSSKGTSLYMGNSGSMAGDPTPGSITTVQRSPAAVGVGCSFERDWRCIIYILSCELLSFKANLVQETAQLDWQVFCRQQADYFDVERSIDGINFSVIKNIQGRNIVNEVENYTYTDNLSSVPSHTIYYRLKTVLRNGKTNSSNVIALKKQGKQSTIQLYPNPAKNRVHVIINSAAKQKVELHILDAASKSMLRFYENLQPGMNSFSYETASVLPSGFYYLVVNTGNEKLINKFTIQK
jgi:uncharacterized repeat protein (TIGR01451 family)